MIVVFCDDNSDVFLKIAQQTYAELGLKGDCSCELIFVDDEEIRELNLQFRKLDKATDVLSFPSLTISDKAKKFSKRNYPFDFDADNGGVGLGSIVISIQTAMQQAEEYGHSLEREKAYLFLHGLLHLLGYDHMDENERACMRSLEEKILNSLGITLEFTGEIE